MDNKQKNEIWNKFLRYLGERIKNLRPGNLPHVRFWTKESGLLPEQFYLSIPTSENIAVFYIKATNPTITIPRGDFERIWEMWQQYLDGELKTEELAEETQYSKYIISILEDIEDSQNKTS